MMIRFEKYESFRVWREGMKDGDERRVVLNQVKGFGRL